MEGDKLLWLAQAYEHHLALLAEAHRNESFEGVNEACIMLIADRVFSGLGYSTWPECRMYDDKRQRADLWAESPTGSSPYLIECKTIWDGVDLRLVRDRFNELVGDFKRLSELTRPAHKVVVWVAFSGDSEIVRVGKDAMKMRLGDALDEVKSKFATASLEGQRCVNFKEFCEPPQWKFGHILCWVVGEAKP